MAKIRIARWDDGKTLYAGAFPDMKSALEQAVTDGVMLDGADLRHANLVNAALDDAVMRGARFDGANLMGANMSEGVFNGAVFAGAGLQNACLCCSSLAGCDFMDAQFGATDIAGADISNCRFSTLSALTLNFRDVRLLDGCVFADPGGAACPFSRPPVAILGLDYPVAVFDRHLKIGAAVREFDIYKKLCK